MTNENLTRHKIRFNLLWQHFSTTANDCSSIHYFQLNPFKVYDQIQTITKTHSWFISINLQVTRYFCSRCLIRLITLQKLSDRSFDYVTCFGSLIRNLGDSVCLYRFLKLNMFTSVVCWLIFENLWLLNLFLVLIWYCSSSLTYK